MGVKRYVPARSPGLKASLQVPPESILASLRLQRAYLDVPIICRVMRKHAESVYLLISRFGLPAVKDGRRWKVDPILFADWLESRGYANQITLPADLRMDVKGDI